MHDPHRGSTVNIYINTSILIYFKISVINIANNFHSKNGAQSILKNPSVNVHDCKKRDESTVQDSVLACMTASMLSETSAEPVLKKRKSED